MLASLVRGATIGLLPLAALGEPIKLKLANCGSGNPEGPGPTLKIARP
jgi:hypothetical protein